ncbi:rhomboid family intramembrane serine protease [Streptomyces sp. G3]|uniref:rhomboid family intramembrane serine protease n=1 Tax=Streptomyces TaxID=1883 RepID=UPI000C9AAD92|nr:MULTISPECIES: rhomboid family intramembrane serine protease [Streptomyces]NDZ76871.1 rhomboid family intramembrane serine protease [Streptomyces sp. SID10362]WSU00625.1 rhomboid family intramembrane serine protease [Streptomyces sp. NBC_01124]AZM74895.1 rhomboid family intramembrane serine protease [Streptomyces sp. KPB2]MBH5135568.1 rhomboid family intramembrane serine protease [Streptomyces sp. HB-N217]MCM1936736.1 rhomboid family intramembrane serine protease [Streptomyces sp. G3]
MVIPVHDVNPARRTPWVTYALILANVLVFLFTPGMTGSATGDGSLAQMCDLQAFLDHWAAVPQELLQHRMPRLVPTGAVGVGPQGPGCVVAPPGYDKSPELSVLTAMFLHGGWLHLLGNMLFLWIFGNNVEDRMGHLPFLLFYGVCGYAATYGFALLNADSGAPLIGASGAIAGVLGAYLVLYPRARVWVLVPFLIFLPLRLPAWLVLGFWFGLQAVYSSGGAVSDAGTVAYVAHVVGFVVGMLIAWPLRRGTPPPPEPRGLLFGRRARPGW